MYCCVSLYSPWCRDVFPSTSADIAIDTVLNSTWVHPTPRNMTMKAWVEENDEDEDHIAWDFVEDFVATRLD